MLGAGGHARRVLDCLLVSRRAKCVVFFDDDPTLLGRQIRGARVVGRISDLSLAMCRELGLRYFVMGIGGDLKLREQFYRRILHNTTLIPLIVSDPTAVWYKDFIGAGTVILANAYVGPGASVGENCIINTGAILEHDCRVSWGSHIAPGAIILGSAQVGEQVLVGANATVLPGVKVGDKAVVGAGAVVDQNVAAETTVVGIPARVVTQSVCPL